MEPTQPVDADTVLDGTMPAPVAAPGNLDTLPATADPVTATTITGLTTQARVTVLPRRCEEGSGDALVHDSQRRFEPLSQLGVGGAGEVWTAEDHDIGRQVALKKIKAEVKSPSALLRFIDEIRTVGRLEHPNIVPVHDVGVDEDGDYYFVMKLIEGETLQSIIDKLAAGDRAYHQEYTFERRMQVFRGVLEAIAFAHSKGIVHRDIKPDNVMVGKFGEVLVMDWGIAKYLGGQATDIGEALEEGQEEGSEDEPTRLWKTQIGSLMGTPAYMSPEQADSKEVDFRSDVYSLCMMLHVLLHLKHYLADRKTLAHMLVGVINDDPPMMKMEKSPHQPTPPMDLLWYARDGLRKDPELRYPSVRAMIDRLDRRAEGIVPVQCHITLSKRVNGGISRFLDRHPIAATLCMLGGIAGIITGVVAAVG